jgi:hypothetical protein
MPAPVRSCHAAADSRNEGVPGSSPGVGLSGFPGVHVSPSARIEHRAHSAHIRFASGADSGLRARAPGPGRSPRRSRRSGARRWPIAQLQGPELDVRLLVDRPSGPATAARPAKGSPATTKRTQTVDHAVINPPGRTTSIARVAPSVAAASACPCRAACKRQNCIVSLAGNRQAHRYAASYARPCRAAPDCTGPVRSAHPVKVRGSRPQEQPPAETHRTGAQVVRRLSMRAGG